MKRIICCSGNGSGAGKTTYAKRTTDQVYSIASALRADLQKKYPNYDWYRTDQDYKDTTTVHELGMTVRKALTIYGQAAAADDPTIWVDKLIDHLKEAQKVVDGVLTLGVDDIRKMCELDAIKNAFPGKVVHVHILGVGAKEEPEFENQELMEIADYLIEW